MRKSFFTKAIVAVGVMASAMALSSMAVWASTNTYYYVSGSTNTNNFFNASTENTNSILTSSFTFNAETVSRTPSKAAKLDSSGTVTFTTSGVSSVELVYGLRTDKSDASNMTIDNTYNFSTTNTSSYDTTTFTGIPSGRHTIKLSSGKEGKIYGIKVVDVVDDNATTYTIDIGEKTNANYPDANVTPTSTINPNSDVTVSWDANDYYKSGSTVITLTEEMLDGTTYTIPYTAFSDNFDAKTNISFSTVINVSDLTTKNYNTVGTHTVNEKLSIIIADVSKNVNIDSANYSFEDANGNDVSTTKRIALGGSGSTSARCVTFKTSTSGDMYIASVGANNRKLIVSDGTTAQEIASSGTATTSDKLSLSANTQYYIYASGGGVNILYIQYTGTLDELNPKVSTLYEAATSLTETFDTTSAGGATVSAKYVYANSTAYFVLDFDLSNVATDVIGLKYQGEDVALYKTVQFAENDTITASDNHALHAFVVSNGTDKGVASVNATVTAVTE